MSFLVNSSVFAVSGGGTSAAFIGQTYTTSILANTAHTIDWPVGTQVGDLAFFYGYRNSIGSYGTISTAGWTQNNGLRYKILDSADLTATISFTSSSNGYFAWVFRGYNVDSVVTYDEEIETVNTSTITWSGGNKTGLEEGLVFITVANGQSATSGLSFTAPTMASAISATLPPNGNSFNGRLLYNFTPAEYANGTPVTAETYGSSNQKFWIIGLTT